MISSTLKIAASLLFAFSILVYAQQPAKKTSTISGKVTVKGKGIAGVYVGARLTEANNREKRRLVARTDVQGNYRIANVSPGTYEITTAAPLYVLSGREALKTLIVGDEESYENIDFTLVRGGVITGRITDSTGQPLVEQRVEVAGEVTTVFTTTDDRGIYRVFGLLPGKYKVSAGVKDDELAFGMLPNAYYKQIFYGATNDPKKATVIEVGEGSETTNVDITLRRPQATFTVSGKIVDAETGRPIPNIVYGLEKFRDNGSYSLSGMIANGQGEFTFDNMTPGNYAVYIERTPALDLFAEPVKFEVTDQDVKGLVIKASGGSSISGVVVMDGVDPKAAANQTGGMLVWAGGATEQEQVFGSRQTARTNADGSFRISGARPGLVQFSVYTNVVNSMRKCDVTRIERDGALETRGIEIKDREQISGLRLAIKCHRGGIRGVVRIENADSPERERLTVFVSRVGDEMFQTGAQLDARGQFVFDGLKAGVYELSVFAHRDSKGKSTSVKQQVVVVDDQVSEVTLTLDLGPKP